MTEDELLAVVRKHYQPIADPAGCDGAQMWNLQWWMPLYGCDTLANMVDDMVCVIERKKRVAVMPDDRTELPQTSSRTLPQGGAEKCKNENA